METLQQLEYRKFMQARSMPCPKCKHTTYVSAPARTIPDHKGYSGKAWINMDLTEASTDSTCGWTLKWKCVDCNFKLVEKNISPEDYEISCSVTKYTPIVKKPEQD